VLPSASSYTADGKALGEPETLNLSEGDRSMTRKMSHTWCHKTERGEEWRGIGRDEREAGIL